MIRTAGGPPFLVTVIDLFFRRALGHTMGPRREQARQQIGAWIDQFYNHRRRHSWCGGISPVAQARQPSQDQQRSAA